VNLRPVLSLIVAAGACLAEVSIGLAAPSGAVALAAPSAFAPAVSRQQALVRMVRQDCGSCHGMRLTGGLGPALTPQALREKPVESLAVTIYSGRPGTPMPPWRAMLSYEEAQWIVEQLLSGFPEEPMGRPH